MSKPIKKRLTRRAFMKTAGAATVAAGTIGFPAIVRSGPTELNISGWGGKWSQIMKKSVYPKFEKEHNCVIKTDTAFPFAPKLLASPKTKPIYDVMHSNSNAQWKVAVAGFLDDLDARKIPNMANLHPFATSEMIAGVAGFTSAIGLGYRMDKTDSKFESWKEFWDPKFAGIRGTYVITNSLGTCAFLMAGKVFGNGLKDTDAALKAMEKLKPVKLVDFTGTMEKLLFSGEVVVGVIHDSAIWRHLDKKAPLAFSAPKEGVLALEQVWSVMKGSPKKELAYAYINYILSPEIQKVIVEGMWYNPANKYVELEQRFRDHLFTTAEQVKQLVQVDWKWYNEKEDILSMKYNKIFQRG
ncbi:MAG: ABC transporter substrate-binding protein [Deltaproteobacteria bacterium]|nr:ABC transporter substrate-binding protein [Deltaproteobacteria bacterium]MBW1962573.1 ABC transporter substrate-binding protein [Deltaproteobacteria bacterium]MBW1995593.1 ABC transporter substrate-binding protein [Deltaproteobacteria bacterium]MBW2153947.1 ABC transporter substrate-binding protein [Deltaproteobacteria bacterium]